MRTHRVRNIAVALAALAAFTLPPQSTPSTRWGGGVAHAFTGKIKSVGKKIGGALKNAGNLLKKAPGLVKVLLQDGARFAKMAARSVSCFARGMKNVAKNLLRAPLRATAALAKRAMNAVGDWVRRSPGDLIREMASSGRDLLGLVRGIRLRGNLSIEGLLRVAGDLATKAFRVMRGQVDRHYQLFFKRLASARNIWPLGCLLEAKPLLDRIYKPLVFGALDRIVGVVKQQYDKGVVKKLPKLIHKAFEKIAKKYINVDALSDSFVGRLIAEDRKIAEVLGGKQVDLSTSQLSRLNGALDALPVTKASFWINTLKGKTVDVLLDKVKKLIEEKLGELIDLVGLKISGLILPIFDVIAGEIGGLVAPLILQVVTVEVGTVGAVGSILTAAVAQIVMGVLTGLWNIVWKWGIAQPLKYLIGVVLGMVKKAIGTAVDAVASLAGGSLDAVLGALRSRIAGKIPLSGAVGKLIGVLATVLEKLGGPRIEALKKHLGNVRGLLGDLAQRGGKVCNASFPKDTVKEPPMDTFDMQGKLVNWLLDKILGAAKGGASRRAPRARRRGNAGTRTMRLARARRPRPAGGAVTNVALRRPTLQSSVAYGGTPGRAVDGNTDGQFFHRSVTHTRGQAQPWWQVDLGRAVSIQKVRIWNRTDCCSARLSNLTVMVSARPFGRAGLAGARRLATFSKVHGGRAPRKLVIPVNRRGRFVRVQLNGRGVLSLAEVEVLGK